MRSQFKADEHLRGRLRSFYKRDCTSNMRCPLRSHVQPWSPNSIVNSWGGLLIPLLNGEDPEKYRVSAMYIEFENNSGAVVTPPTFERTDDMAAYYASLADSPTRDYLRVPVIARAYSKSDESYPFDNVMMITARTSGTVGQHGKPFSAAQQSRVYGGAALAMPDESDDTQDRILARAYWSSSSSQLVKLIGSEIGYDWEFTAR